MAEPEPDTLSEVSRRGLVMLGCGKMGQALLDGWLDRGLVPDSVHVRDPAPSERLESLARDGLRLNGDLPDRPAVCLIAVKPQIIDDALPAVAALDTLFVSIAAGIPLSRLAAGLGSGPIIRVMPNTPAAVGRGISAVVGNAASAREDLDMARTLMRAVGEVVTLEAEDQMDAVTAVSGSGPAYVFHLIECLAAAGEAEGLPPDTARALARATVAGAGALADASGEDPEVLRTNVTSPGGTTEAGLKVLMDEADGLPPVIRRTVSAAAQRSRDLANG